MQKKVFTAIVACISSMMFFACSQKDLRLEAAVFDAKTEKWGYANEKGKIIIPGKYDLAKNFGNSDLAEVYIGTLNNSAIQDEGKWGLIDRTGKEVVPCKYSRIYNFQEGLAEVYIGKTYNGASVGGKFGFIDITGVEVVPCKYDYTFGGFNEGLAAVNIGGEFEFVRENNRYSYRGGKWGYIDKTGKEVTPFEYSEAGKFSEGKALVAINENGIRKVGYIDNTGIFISPPIEHSYTKYTGNAAAENGQTLMVTFTLETTGSEQNITGFKIIIGKENMTSYDEESSTSIKVEQDGTFSSGDTNGLSGTIKSGKIDCVFTKSNGQKYILSAYPEKKI